MNQNTTSSMSSEVAAMQVANMITSAKQMRVRWERTWYDNAYFDDGFHFRYVSRDTGRIIDKTNSSNAPNKMRAIPKASKQIRGLANLLVGTNPHPVILPEPILQSMFPNDVAAYQTAKDWSKEVAKKSGHWLYEELDKAEFEDKLIETVINASKMSVGYLKIVPDPLKEKIIMVTRDAFDVYLLPMVKDIDDSPFVAESVPVQVQDVWNNETYDPVNRASVVPDNRFGASAVKDAYMRSRFGTALQGEEIGTAIITEAYVREFLDKSNYDRIIQQEDAELVLAGKKMGDPIIRQIISTRDGKPLYDHYTTLSKYPYAPFRFEPGYMYQVSQIERFIPANKSLDAVVSRIEGLLHTMVVGTWLKKKGEGFKLSNQYGGQVLEYENTPPTQGQAASVPGFVFQFIGLLNSFIEEQGLSVNTLAQIPSGVKAFRAIESLKESELNNLHIPLQQLKKTVKRVAELYLQYADDYFSSPRPVSVDDDNEPSYYDVVGNRAYEARKGLGMNVNGMTPIKKELPVKVEIENGAAFTEEGRKTQMLELINTLAPLFANGALPPEFLKLMATELVDTFKVGSLQDMTEALDKVQDVGQMNDTDIEKVKVAMLEVMKDTAGAPAQPESQNVVQG